MAIKPAPTIAIHTRAGPGPVTARAPDVPAEFEEEAEAATAGDTACPADDDAVGAFGDGVPEAAPEDAGAGAGVEAEVETGFGVGGAVGAGVGVGGAVGAGVGAAGVGNLTTENPPTPFPVAWPGAVSPTNVYRGEPL